MEIGNPWAIEDTAPLRQDGGRQYPRTSRPAESFCDETDDPRGIQLRLAHSETAMSGTTDEIDKAHFAAVRSRLATTLDKDF